MALKIERPVPAAPVGVPADRRLYVNAERTKLVPEGSPEAAFLLALPGDVVPAELAAALGLTAAPASAEAAAPEAPAPDPAEPEQPAKGRARAPRARHAPD